MILSRRAMLIGLAAPAVVRASSLMPISAKLILPPEVIIDTYIEKMNEILWVKWVYDPTQGLPKWIQTEKII